MKKILNILGHLLALLIIGLITFWISTRFAIWDGYPKGNDSVGQVFHVLQIARFWPNIHWYHAWTGGMPLFIWYPILPYLLPALLIKTLGLSASLTLVTELIVGIALTGFAVYGVVWLFSKNWFLSLAAGILCVVAPASYNHAFSGGQFARNFGFTFYAATLWAAFWYFKKRTRFAYGLTVIFTALGTLSHYVTAVGIYPSIVLISLLQPIPFKRRIALIFKILVPALLLIVFFLVPSVVNPMYIDPTPTFWENNRRNIRPFGWLINFRGNIASLNTLHPLLFIPAAILLVLVIVLARKRLLAKKQTFRAVVFFVLGILAALAYYYVVIPIYPLYLVNGAPSGTLTYFPILISALLGILGYILFRSKILASSLGILLTLAIIVWGFNHSDYDSLFGRIRAGSLTNETQEKLLRELLPSDKQFNFRVGTGDEGSTSAWFNIVFPFVPQTRNYFGAGMLDVDNYVYAFLSIWRWTDNFEETKFNLDWWAVKQFISMEPSLFEKFGSSSSEYVLKFNKPILTGYDYTKASPVLSTTNAPTLLVIGGDEISYDSVLRSLAQVNLNSQYLIPIKGRSGFIDDYKESELEKFSAVLLYNYRFHNTKAAVSLLKKYIESGGGLIVESNKHVDEKAVFNSLLPLTDIDFTDFGKSWQLSKGNLGEEVLTDIDFTDFGPAIFDEQPWTMGVAIPAKSEDEAFLLNYGKPLIIGGQKGQGRIIWSGMNLPYHINTYKNKEEAKMFGEILDWLVDIDRESFSLINYPQENNSLTYETDEFQATFVDPQKRKMLVKTDTAGILFKESYFYNWRARLKNKNLTIYKAGPGMMYVPGPFTSGDELTFIYKLAFWPHQITRLISLVTAIFFAIYLFKGKFFLTEPVKRATRQLSQWWARENEE